MYLIFNSVNGLCCDIIRIPNVLKLFTPISKLHNATKKINLSVIFCCCSNYNEIIDILFYGCFIV